MNLTTDGEAGKLLIPGGEAALRTKSKKEPTDESSDADWMRYFERVTKQTIRQWRRKASPPRKTEDRSMSTFILKLDAKHEEAINQMLAEIANEQNEDQPFDGRTPPQCLIDVRMILFDAHDRISGIRTMAPTTSEADDIAMRELANAVARADQELVEYMNRNYGSCWKGPDQLTEKK